MARTPKEFLRPGTVLRSYIDGIGELRNPIDRRTRLPNTGGGRWTLSPLRSGPRPPRTSRRPRSPRSPPQRADVATRARATWTCGTGRPRTSTSFWASGLGVLRRAGRDTLRRGTAGHPDAGRAVVPRGPAELPPAPPARPGRRRRAIVDVREGADGAPTGREITAGRAAGPGRGIRAELTDLGVRPGDRVVGYLPNIPEAVIALLGAASVGAVWSGCGQEYSPTAAAAPARPARAGGPGDCRRVPLRRADARPSSGRGATACGTAHRAGDGAGRADRRRPARRRPTVAEPPTHRRVRPGRHAERAPVVGRLLLRHDRPTQGHRAQHRRHRARAPQDHGTRPGPRPGRHLLLAHLAQLDGLELPRLGMLSGARIVTFDGSPTHPSPDVLWRIAAEQRVTAVAPARATCGARGRGLDPGYDARPQRTPFGRLVRLASVPGGLLLGRRPRRAAGAGQLDHRRHRRRELLRRRRPDRPGVAGGAVGPRPGRRARRLGRGRQAGPRPGRGARGHRADAVHADQVLGRPRRRAIPGVLLRHLPRGVAPRRLDHDHRTDLGDRARPLGRHAQPQRHPHGQRRHLPRPRAAHRRGRQPGRRRRTGRRRLLDAAVRQPRRGPRARRRAARRHRRRDPPRRLARPTSPTR